MEMEKCPVVWWVNITNSLLHVYFTKVQQFAAASHFTLQNLEVSPLNIFPVPPQLFVLFLLPFALTSGCYGEQQGGGTHSGSDGRRRGCSRQVVRRMRRSNCRPLPALLHGAILAHAMPQVLLLPRSARRVQQHLLQQRRHDPLQERLHQVSPRQRLLKSKVMSSLCFFSPTNSPNHEDIQFTVT